MNVAIATIDSFSCYFNLKINHDFLQQPFSCTDFFVTFAVFATTASLQSCIVHLPSLQQSMPAHPSLVHLLHYHNNPFFHGVDAVAAIIFAAIMKFIICFSCGFYTYIIISCISNAFLNFGKIG